MRTYYLQLTNFDASIPGNILAINNPAGSGKHVVIRCVSNVYADSITTAIYRLERHTGQFTGGDALSVEPGDDSPRIARRDSLTKNPGFSAVTGAFVSPNALKYDETFTLISRAGSSQHLRNLDEQPLLIRPNECAILALMASDASIASVAIEMHESDAIPPLALPMSPFVRLVGESFTGSGGLSGESWDVTELNGGSDTLGNGECLLSTGASANGSIIVSSNRTARFLTNAVHEFVAVARLGDMGSVDNSRVWGPFTPDGLNGYGFSLNGATIGVVIRKDGVSTFVDQTLWDLDNFVIDTNVHEWATRYSADRVEFWIDGALRHSINYGILPHVSDRDFAIRFENVNTNGLASSRTFGITATAIRRHGPAHGAVRYHHFDGTAQAVTLKTGSGTLAQILITKAGTGGSSIVVYDGVDNTGNVIADITGDAIAELPFGSEGAEFSTGLHIVTSANSGKSTVFFD